MQSNRLPTCQTITLGVGLSKTASACRDKKRRKAESKKERAAAEQAGGDIAAGLTPEDIQMMMACGIPFGFGSTAGTEVDDDTANASAIQVRSQRKARQFMNRKGGFNRPLPAERTGEKMNEA